MQLPTYFVYPKNCRQRLEEYGQAQEGGALSPRYFTFSFCRTIFFCSFILWYIYGRASIPRLLYEGTIKALFDLPEWKARPAQNCTFQRQKLTLINRSDEDVAICFLSSLSCFAKGDAKLVGLSNLTMQSVLSIFVHLTTSEKISSSQSLLKQSSARFSTGSHHLPWARTSHRTPR